MIKNLLVLLCFSFLQAAAQPATPGQPLPAWQPGYLDLHHINTGRGNSAYFIFPDGTSLLVDAGELDPTSARTFSPRNTPIRPNTSLQPYEWIASYIRQFSPAHENAVIDYALITHFHDDHFGGWYPGAPQSADRKFVRSGITGIGDIMPLHLLLTRDYQFPVPPDSLFARLSAESPFVKGWKNYMAFVQAAPHGMKSQFLRAGSASQIHLNYQPASYTDFQVRNIKSNGKIWTGRDSSTSEHFSQVDPKKPGSWPDENPLSNAILISYGDFRYYTGGDNPGNVFFGDSAWRNTESAMAPVIGQVDVATMNHHGNRDALNEDFIKTLQPRIWVEQVWSSDHPGAEVLRRIMSKLYAGPRDLFATNMLEPNKLVIGPMIEQSYKSLQGHILVRVMPGGKQYWVIILEDGDADRKVKAVFGPYASKKNGS